MTNKNENIENVNKGNVLIEEEMLWSYGIETYFIWFLNALYLINYFNLWRILKMSILISKKNY